ncbi:MAG: hypothetical protein FJ387_00805 [Verrucomicrobia bacterium]|nr:hypothetical protein [Verrucomicrobiota bacterium]
MKLEVFTLCDAATDSGGKLNILGAFDRLGAPQAPMVQPHCAVAARLRFHRIEEGRHKLRVTFGDEDGKTVLPAIEGEVGVRFGETARSAAFNLIMGINGLKLERFGEYTVDLAVDGVHLGTLPLYFEQLKPPA